MQNLYKSHPIADAFPLMRGKEFDELVEDIRQNGLLNPIVIFEDQILDGRNRYSACQLTGVEPHYTRYLAKMDPESYVISLNLRRRHLTASQMGAAMANLATLKRGRPSENQEIPSIDGISFSSAKSVSKLAKEGHVSTKTIERALVVKKADPELFKEVQSGNISVNKAEISVKERKRKLLENPFTSPTPGQVLKQSKSRSRPDQDGRILAAINSGNGLTNAAKEAAEAEELGFDDQHLKALIDQLKAEIGSRRDMQRALEAHYNRRNV